VCAVVRLAENYGVFVRQIDVDFPAHTSALDPLRPMFARMLPAAQFTDVPVECIAASTGAAIPAGTKFGDHWDENLRNTVRFDRAIQEATQRGAAMFIELSAHPSLQYALTELADGTLILGSGRRDQPIAETLSANIAAAAVADPGHRWTDTAAHPGRPVLRGFPNAPMHAWHLWAGSEPATGDSAVSYLAERWQPQQPDARVSVTSCGLAVVAPEHETAALASALEQAAARLDCRSVPPAEAEIVVVVAPPLTHPDPLGAAGELGGRPGAGLPDYRGLIGPRCRGVWLLTFGGEQVGPEDPTALPAQAALAAMHRCAGFEFPDQVFAHLDLPADGTDVETAAEVLLGPLTEVALRGRTRYTRQLREHGRPSPRPLEAAALENVVITGGSGAIGLHYARHCIAGGARRVILLSRGGIDAATLAGLTEGHRAQVHAPKCDINDPDALSAAASACAGDGASLLIHAAGIARFGPQQRIGAADLAAVFGAKVAGLSRMADIWPLRADARILLCSSVSGVWGGHGHGAYAAANRMLDIAATRLRAAGHDATAVRWGLWQDTTIADADEIARIERAGLAAMDPVEAIDASLRCHDGDPLIVAADIDRLRVVFESQGGPTLVDAASGTRPEADVSGPVPVAEAVRGALAAALSLPGTDVVDPHTALIDLGVDSLLALDLRKRLRASTGRTVALARLLGGITGAELIDELQPTSTREGGVPA
jgi:mycobactin polyketide synthetase MbtD